MKPRQATFIVEKKDDTKISKAETLAQTYWFFHV
jgi:hypothetical protein